VCGGRILVAGTLDLAVAAGTDDGRWREGDSFFAAGETSVSIGYLNGAAGACNLFARLDNVTIPKGAIIDSAIPKLRSTSTPTAATTVNLLIRAVKAANPAAPTTYAGIEEAAKTTAAVEWNNVAAWPASTWIEAPDIAAVLQELIDQAGWASGNAVLLTVEDNGSTVTENTIRELQTYDNYAPNALALHVEYRV
jgi:hypothetical protein